MNVKFNGIEQNKVNELEIKVATGKKKTAREIHQEKLKQEKAQGKTLKGFELNLAKDPISQKLEKAREEAMKKLQNVLKDHMDVADEITERQEHIAELDKDILGNQEMLDKIEESKKALAKQYEGNENSKEYKNQLLQLDKQYGEIKGRVDLAQCEKEAESKTINKIHLALLKADPMVGAQKEADNIMDKANEEVISDLVDEAKDKTEEKLEEQIEKAQEEKEEKKEEEKKKVEKEKEQDQLEARTKNVREDNKSPQEVAVENDDLNNANEVIQTADSTQNKLKDEIKNILKAQQLVEDDLKGLEVDQTV